jgi:hypothetical protein
MTSTDISQITVLIEEYPASWYRCVAHTTAAEQRTVRWKQARILTQIRKAMHAEHADAACHYDRPTQPGTIAQTSCFPSGTLHLRVLRASPADLR